MYKLLLIRVQTTINNITYSKQINELMGNKMQQINK